MPMFMRSQIPIVGVGPFIGMLGASRLVRTPNKSSKTIDHIVNTLKRRRNATDPKPIINIIRTTVTDAHKMCKVSVKVGWIPLMCIGGQ